MSSDDHYYAGCLYVVYTACTAYICFRVEQTRNIHVLLFMYCLKYKKDPRLFCLPTRLCKTVGKLDAALLGTRSLRAVQAKLAKRARAVLAGLAEFLRPRAFQLIPVNVQRF